MSQINDALKRAQDTPPKNMPSSMAPMLPVDALAAEHGANWIRPAAIILVLLLIASLFIAISSGSHPGPKVVAAPAAVPAPVVKIAPAARAGTCRARPNRPGGKCTQAGADPRHR